MEKTLLVTRFTSMSLGLSSRILTHRLPPHMYHRSTARSRANTGNTKTTVQGFSPQHFPNSSRRLRFHFWVCQLPLSSESHSHSLPSHRIFLQYMVQSNCVLTGPSSLQRACCLLTHAQRFLLLAILFP